MAKQSRRISRDPYFYWKIVNMILAGAVVVLGVLILLGIQGGWLVPVTILLGVLMGAFCGIMELAKGRRVLGYSCSVFAGIMTVALMLSIIRIW